MMSTSALGSMFLAVTLAAPPPVEPAANEPTAPTEPDPTIAVPRPVEPQQGALDHLERAQELEAAGELEAAEAEVSLAISLQPDDAPPYLVRAQIRIGLADRSERDEPAARRSRAALLRSAAEDLGTYVEHAELQSDGVAWFRAHQQALLREADALDSSEVAEPAPTPTITTEPTAHPIDDEPQLPAGAWIGTGAVAAGAAVGLVAAGLRIEQRCTPADDCTARWRAQAPLLAPGATLAALGTTAIVVGLAKAPALERARPRRAVIATGVALGATAIVLGTITGAFTGVRWAVVSPADDAALGITQTLGNTAAASFTAALPLLGAGITAWVRGHKGPSSARMARRGR